MSRALACTAASLALATAAPSLVHAGTYKNEAIGFQLSVPGEYTEVPPKATEPFIVARFLSKKKQFWTD